MSKETRKMELLKINAEIISIKTQEIVGINNLQIQFFEKDYERITSKGKVKEQKKKHQNEERDIIVSVEMIF